MLEVANLEVVYHGVVRVLGGVSLSVPEGRVVALLGPNGAGKTSALRALTGLLYIHDGAVTKGTASWEGHDLLSLRSHQIVASGVGQVMERRRILADLTVEENLLAGAFRVRPAEARQGLADAWERFPVLRERRRQLAGYLSGGEQQMLAIARALMGRPRLLLLDEPSLGLAPRVAAEVGALVRRINAEGVTVLLVEQNAALALSLADHGYVMETGRIVMSGTAEELLRDQDIREFYLGFGGDAPRSYRDIKHYRRRKRWLS